MSSVAVVESPAPLEVPKLSIEIADGISLTKVVVMVAALISLFIDQSFGAVYGSIANYAGGTLGASADEFSWATIGYTTCYWTVILLSPWLVNRYGRRGVFGYGHAFFGVTSFYLAITTSLHGFIVGRAIQGIAQGTFFVCSVATVLTLFPARYRGITFSIFSVTSLSAAASGSFVGGWFVDHAYWRGALALYGLLATIAGTIVALLLQAPAPDRSTPHDWRGVELVFVAFFGYQFVAAFGERRDWLGDESIVWFSLLCVAGFVSFVLWELRRGAGSFIKLGLFSTGNLAVGSILGFCLGSPLFGANTFLQYAQSVLGFPPSTAGALLTLRIIAIVVVAPTAVLLVNADKIDVKIPVAIGFVIVPVSYALLAVQTTYLSHFWVFGVALILSGAGFACLFSPVANVTIRSLPPAQASQGIAIFKMSLLIGGSIASTGLTVLYDRDFASYQSLLRGAASLAHLQTVGTTIAPAAYAGLVSAQASVLAFADNSKWIALTSLLALPLVALLKKPPSS